MEVASLIAGDKGDRVNSYWRYKNWVNEVSNSELRKRLEDGMRPYQAL